MLTRDRKVDGAAVLVAGAAWLFAAGCQSPRTNSDPAFAGRWVTGAGAGFEIQPEATLGNVIVAERPDGSRVTCGQLVSVDGKTIAQIRLLDVDPAAAHPDRQVDIYSFGVLEQSGDVLFHRPIRPEWFALHAGTSNVRFVRTDAAKPGSGVALASNQQELTVMLRKALADPTALAPAERFTRVNKK